MMIRDGDFADFFFQCFKTAAFLQISTVSSFLHSNQRERNEGKNAYKITLTEPQREMREKLLTNISPTEPQLREPLNSERHAVHTFIILTSGVLNGIMATILFGGCIFCIDVISCWR